MQKRFLPDGLINPKESEFLTFFFATSQVCIISYLGHAIFNHAALYFFSKSWFGLE